MNNLSTKIGYKIFQPISTYKCGHLTADGSPHIGYTIVSNYSSTVVTQRKAKIIRSLNIIKCVKRMSGVDNC